jgi:hypothetical protein
MLFVFHGNLLRPPGGDLMGLMKKIGDFLMGSLGLTRPSDDPVPLGFAMSGSLFKGSLVHGL